MVKARFSHVNLSSRNWRALADFYMAVFGCIEKPPVRELDGAWLDALTGMPKARIKGIHLILPGFGDHGPTLEIFEYHENRVNGDKAINLEGFGHIAFAVEDVDQSVALLLSHGGSLVGEVVSATVAGVGNIAVVYARDPEGNIIELQKWSS